MTNKVLIPSGETMYAEGRQALRPSEAGWSCRFGSTVVFYTMDAGKAQEWLDQEPVMHSAVPNTPGTIGAELAADECGAWALIG